MALETSEYITGLVSTNPPDTDPKSQGAAHLRLIKAALLNSFVGFNGMVLVTGLDTGATNAFNVPLSGEPTVPGAYTTGMIVVFKALNANTGASTLNVGGIGTKSLLTHTGAALTANQIPAGSIVAAFYDGTNFYAINV